MKQFIFSLIFCCLIPALGFSQIATPVVWFKADSVSSQKNTWPDNSPSGYHAQFSQDTFRLGKGVLNYNDAILFDSSEKYFKIPYCKINTNSELTIITVFYTADTTECGLWGLDSLCTRSAGQTTRRVLGPDSLFESYLKSEGKAVLNRVVQQWPSGNTTTPDSNSAMILGSFALNQDSIADFKGHLAEYLVFDNVLNGVEQAQVETYLAIKYGIHLELGNYVSSDKVVLWNRKNDSLYSNRITGIGRDDGWRLHQKQSTAASENEFLVIGAGEIAQTNKENASPLSDKNFLIWGDNNGLLSQGDSSGSLIPLLERRWQMKLSGTAAKQTTTQVLINKNRLSQQDSVYFLIIDRSGTNNFSGASYIQSDSIIDDSIVVFNNVNWDTDGSGKDIFSFGTSEEMTIADSVLRHPLCAYSDEGEALFQTSGGHAPFYYTAKLQGSDTITSEWTASSDSIVQTGFKGGVYEVCVTDATGLTAETTIEIIAPDSLYIDLGEDRSLSRKEIYEFDASSQVPDSLNVTYLWEGALGFSSDRAEVKLSEPDLYTLTVTTDSGCVYSDQILLGEDPLRRFDVTPSLVHHGGKVNIHIHFNEPTDIQLSLVGTDGKEYWTKQETGKKSYNFSENIQKAGIYYLVLQTSTSLEATKILVLK